MAKRSTSRKTTTTRTRKPQTRTRQKQPALEPLLRPEHQRELFAIALITIAIVTIVFYFTGAAGAIGQRWVMLTQQLLGWGSLLVPLSLGLLGVAILWQEQREDIRLTGAMVMGTGFVLMSLLVLLEYTLEPVRESLNDKVGEGGGIIGFTLLDVTAGAIGRPASFVVFLALGLAGILLTFNITLRELLRGMRDSFARFWVTVWSAAPNRSARERATLAAQPATEPPMPTYVPPPGAPDDIELTPIAERPTRASLFKRPEKVVQSSDTSADSKQGKTRRERKATKSQPEEVLDELLSTPITTPAEPVSNEVPVETVQQPLEGFEVSAVHRAWPLPPVDMFDTYVEGVISDEERRHKARLIEETLESFKVEVSVTGVNTGPAVTQFEVQPAVGVKVSKITTLEKDLALALAAPSIRIEAPIPGKSVIGLEIPNSAVSVVSMREVVESDEFEKAKAKLKFPLGKDVSGQAVVAGMERMPHLLVAGSTGSGKSVAVNVFICALLLRHTPDELKFIMVDPKMVELIVYNQIPHLLSPVVTELERVVPTLRWATAEMERRYKVFAKYGFRNIDSYKQASRQRADLEPMPYIVIIIDELADLMMMAPDEVETLLCRLAQMARATGIHLIIATQRPSVDVVTGLIKANFPSRIAFAVTSQIDSRVILDMNGAEQLLGRGDMLYLATDAAKPVRIQGTYASDEEVERVVSFWRTAQPPATSGTDGKQGKQRATPPQATIKGPGEFLEAEEQDTLLPEAIKLIKQHQRASASLLQRRLRIGYSKAAQLIDLLEQQGVVGPAESGRSREVLLSDSDES
ncbi:MAG: DNA translocase FtsK [Chloroflexi bacterium AL-W]|nr:DNA translocase FtsK [Chloroflexi bacterium AL-N1]NOK65432.1 DNA translocase FtsK [Chloroflexi bacterium AL-N10]NOK72302.1 DNA translocase FtsK [Chloroflexi bacterium AL-N5]NOK79611.1 DNA translocase FtsK [Chloroflexi bacterium AL-W]NOK87527.1 DNA translocase FtsK [Chloroflexi bacterium AL-N15]